ncbi:hypothetical protein [Xenorhabdus sp. PB30.3]|uniref:hypothetical protein n=1 Tax=Xenorhabdus sp. PB30.3 TaxID=2788941 RepID=UPI001E411602|nr:hypothetical protein [Xenorhabdus sp. PB30.3]MCC8379121.1 hypothetical protein [Xenorhabdus sp. PB30.3]
MNNVQKTVKKRHYTRDELVSLADKRGYLLNFSYSLKVFELRNKKHPDNWGWIIRPSNGVKVGLVRECEMQEWDDILNYNIKRLESIYNNV